MQIPWSLLLYYSEIVPIGQVTIGNFIPASRVVKIESYEQLDMASLYADFPLMETFVLYSPELNKTLVPLHQDGRTRCPGTKTTYRYQNMCDHSIEIQFRRRVE
ncbi:hypothetical protein J3458_005332 [Metarhizium acridum]|uniref:uncharacterized protein n=1 Tax=Metarhizium acridum TaxID=92637 RepID=UPI001C6D1DD3|nr:hypothetical protein J3458_005332 [Metarhizium acridum]